MMTSRDAENLFQLKQKVLGELYHELSQNIFPANHLSFLRSKFVITYEEQQQIENLGRIESTAASARRLLDIIKTKNHGFDELCNSLMDNRTQMFLLERLNVALQMKINEFHNMQTMNIIPTGQRSQVSDLPVPPLPNGEENVNDNNLSHSEVSSSEDTMINSLSSNFTLSLSSVDAGQRQSTSIV